jgi:hypothetical protein
MAIPSIQYRFSASRWAKRIRFHWTVRNITGDVKRLEMELTASPTARLHGDIVRLYRGPVSRSWRRNGSFHVDVPLAPVVQKQWNYFWARVRVLSGRHDSQDVVLLNGHGNEPLYANGSVVTPTAFCRIDPGTLFCPECGIRFNLESAFFGSAPNTYIASSRYLGLQGVVIVTGRRGKKRMRSCAVDSGQNTYPYIFCPNKHPLPYMTGVYDRLVVGILGEQPAVVRYFQEWQKTLLQRNDMFFAEAAQDARVGGGQQGVLMALHPQENQFPLYLWMYRLWAGANPPSDSWRFARHINGLVLLVDPRNPRRSANLLSRFWEKTDALPGEKLPVSVAIVLTGCDFLIRSKVLPQNIAWNLPNAHGSQYNPLVQCDTSARIGEYVARTTPQLYRLAQDRFSSVAYFGTGSMYYASNGELIHRGEDALMWMLAQRKQIPILKPAKAFTQISSHARGNYVFDASH